jgi:hypothetical protein
MDVRGHNILYRHRPLSNIPKLLNKNFNFKASMDQDMGVRGHHNIFRCQPFKRYYDSLSEDSNGAMCYNFCNKRIRGAAVIILCLAPIPRNQ